MSMSGTGSAIFPFIIGAAASKKGVTVLQPTIFGTYRGDIFGVVEFPAY
ncbi:hypothetical protein ARSEF4850_003205 [Beauveria asiatica]